MAQPGIDPGTLSTRGKTKSTEFYALGGLKSLGTLKEELYICFLIFNTLIVGLVGFSRVGWFTANKQFLGLIP